MSPQLSGIAHYRISGKLGEGGMGAVYRATDTKLNREVAIKVLPDAFASDPDRLARFTREAQVLASLNHPNVAGIYGVEERAIVMELVEGESPAGPMPAEDALPILEQLIDALEYAHERGVVHRDLKPANLKLTRDGRLKVLDFGLAKALTPDTVRDAADKTASPTLTMRATMAGMVMGTAAYMSPEQARGQDVDKRADIWSFGVVVYELLTGKALFDGGTVTDTLAAVLRQELDLSVVPAKFRSLLAKCLARDPRQRLRDIGDARLLLDASGEFEPAPVAARPARVAGERVAWTAGCVVLAGIAAGLYFRPSTNPSTMRLSLLPPAGERFHLRNYPAISPDGRMIAFTSAAPEGTLQLQHLDSAVSRVIAQSPVNAGEDPFWSPDSKMLAFFSGQKLRRVDVASGAIQTICDAPGGRGGTWNRDGVIVFAPQASGPLFRVPASGGEPVPVTEVSKDGGAVVSHRHPWFLPDGKHFLYLSRSAGQGSIEWGVLGSKDHGRIIDSAVTTAIYVEPGFLLYMRDATLLALPFDASALKPKGEAFPVAEHVHFSPVHAKGEFTASSNGLLVYGASLPRMDQLAWFDVSGRELGRVDKPYSGGRARLSPDGNLIAEEVQDAESGLSSIWIIDAVRGGRNRLTSSGQNETAPVWSPDSRSIAFTTVRDGRPVIAVKRANWTGDETVLFHSPFTNTRATDWTRDGRFLLVNGFEAWTSIWQVPVAGGATPTRLASEPNVEQNSGRLSPDGHWLAYVSGSRVFVMDYPGLTTKVQIFNENSGDPQWSPDGKVLYFRSHEKLLAAAVKASARFETAEPRTVVSGAIRDADAYSVHPDGKRLLVKLATEEDSPSAMTVLVNWRANADSR